MPRCGRHAATESPSRAGADALINLNADRLQCLLSGHPKFLIKDARFFGAKDALERYAPGMPAPSDCTGWRSVNI